jgi:hypothetical protein
MPCTLAVSLVGPARTPLMIMPNSTGALQLQLLPSSSTAADGTAAITTSGLRDIMTTPQLQSATAAGGGATTASAAATATKSSQQYKSPTLSSNSANAASASASAGAHPRITPKMHQKVRGEQQHKHQRSSSSGSDNAAAAAASRAALTPAVHSKKLATGGSSSSSSSSKFITPAAPFPRARAFHLSSSRPQEEHSPGGESLEDGELQDDDVEEEQEGSASASAGALERLAEEAAKRATSCTSSSTSASGSATGTGAGGNGNGKGKGKRLRDDESSASAAAGGGSVSLLATRRRTGDSSSSSSSYDRLRGKRRALGAATAAGSALHSGGGGSSSSSGFQEPLAPLRLRLQPDRVLLRVVQRDGVHAPEPLPEALAACLQERQLQREQQRQQWCAAVETDQQVQQQQQESEEDCTAVADVGAVMIVGRDPETLATDAAAGLPSLVDSAAGVAAVDADTAVGVDAAPAAVTIAADKAGCDTPPSPEAVALAPVTDADTAAMETDSTTITGTTATVAVDDDDNSGATDEVELSVERQQEAERQSLEAAFAVEHLRLKDSYMSAVSRLKLACTAAQVGLLGHTHGCSALGRLKKRATAADAATADAVVRAEQELQTRLSMVMRETHVSADCTSTCTTVQYLCVIVHAVRWQTVVSVLDCHYVLGCVTLLELPAARRARLVCRRCLVAELMKFCALCLPLTLLQAAVAEVLARQRLEACTLQALHSGALPLHSGQAPCAAVQFPYPELFTLTSLA